MWNAPNIQVSNQKPYPPRLLWSKVEKVGQIIFSSQHYQQGCIGCRSLMWSQMAHLSQFWPCLIPWINILGLSCLIIDIQGLLQLSNLGQCSWKWSKIYGEPWQTNISTRIPTDIKKLEYLPGWIYTLIKVPVSMQQRTVEQGHW